MQSLFNNFIKAVVILVIFCITNNAVLADYKPDLNEWNKAEIACAALRLHLVIAAKYYEPEHSKKTLIALSLAEVSRFANGLLHYKNHSDDDIRIVLIFAALEIMGIWNRVSTELSYQKNKKKQIEILEKRALAMGYKIPVSNQEEKVKPNKLDLVAPFIEGCAAIYKAYDNTIYDNPNFNNRRIATIIEMVAQG